MTQQYFLSGIGAFTLSIVLGIIAIAVNKLVFKEDRGLFAQLGIGISIVCLVLFGALAFVFKTVLEHFFT